MTKAFITFWKLASGCKACLAIPGKHMCAACRKKALLSWHKYVAQRVTKGLCIQCPRERKPNEQRCPTCAEANRLHCLDWSRRFAKQRTDARRAAGKCIHHPGRQAVEGSCYCQPCRSKARARRLGLYVPTKRPYKFLSLEA